MALQIHGFQADDLDDILALSLRAWAPVFSALQGSVAPFVLSAFYPDGWWARQKADIEGLAKDDQTQLRVARDGVLLGFVGIRLHPEDSMGEIHILAVDPDRQRQGIATALMNDAFQHIKDAGMSMVMVETGGDPGHAPARAAYEHIGFERWPVARYFRAL